MNVQHVSWIVLALIVAFFLYNRFAGKTSSAEAHRWVSQGARLVDVRSPAEFNGGHLDGAVNIPVDQVDSRAGELGPKDNAVVVYCASGMRSASAARKLRSIGFVKVADLGPMSAW